jgi:hypothetical protein
VFTVITPMSVELPSKIIVSSLDDGHPIVFILDSDIQEKFLIP